LYRIVPAYGRSYSSADEVLEAWNSNKDFKLYSGPYLNKQDWEKYGSKLDSLLYDYCGITVCINQGWL